MYFENFGGCYDYGYQTTHSKMQKYNFILVCSMGKQNSLSVYMDPFAMETEAILVHSLYSLSLCTKWLQCRTVTML